MKNLFFVSLVGVFLFGCLANVPSKVCPPPDGKQSWICEKSEQAGVTPEQVYGWIFSASAIGAITDVTSIEWLCEFKGKISDWYVEVYPVSYDSVINKVIKEMKLIDDPASCCWLKILLTRTWRFITARS